MEMTPSVPTTSPYRVAADTWLIPNIVPAGPGAYLPVNSMLIRGAEPIVVDTGAPVHRDHWAEMVFGLVDPKDIRWVFLPTKTMTTSARSRPSSKPLRRRRS